MTCTPKSKKGRDCCVMGKWNEILLGFNFDVVTGMFGTTNLPAQPCLIPKMGSDQPLS